MSLRRLFSGTPSDAFFIAVGCGVLAGFLNWHDINLKLKVLNVLIFHIWVPFVVAVYIDELKKLKKERWKREGR